MTSLARLEQQIELASAAVAKVQVKNGGDRVPSGEIEHEMQSFQLVLEKSKAQLEDLKNRLKERTREKGTARRNKDEEQEIVAEVSAEREAIAIKNTEDLAEKYSYFKPIVVSQKKDEGRQDESTPEEQAKEEQLVPRDDTNETGLEKQANKEHPPSQSDLNDGSKTNNARDTKLEVDAFDVTIKDAKPEAHASSTTKSPSWFGCTTPIWNNEDAMSEIEVTLQEVLECRVPKKEADTPDKTEPSRQLEADVTTVTVKEAKPEAQASATTQSLSWFGCTVPIWNTEAASPEIEITLQEILECIATKQEADTTVKNKSCRQEPIDVSAEENKARENFLICMKRHGSLVKKGISTQSEQFVKSEATLRESLTRLQYWERRRATADSSCTLK